MRKLQIKLEFRGWNCLSRDKGDKIMVKSKIRREGDKREKELSILISPTF